jgi:beta-lactamase regulating signal transducer with metallopeptidase domain
MMALLLNHLWQSSLCLGGAGLLALALHRNGANVRFWLWFAASVKFLVPFALLTALSAYFLPPILPPVAAPAVILIARPFAAISLPTAPPAAHMATPSFAAPLPAAAADLDLTSVLLALWAAGFLVIAVRWLVRWSRIRALLQDATTIDVDAPIAVKFSSSRLEPGLVGILRPVILLPRGIEQQLSPAELKAVLAHELCHWRRHDNLLAAIHMLVEALFWFFPLVWWLGARLNEERERACDEGVLAGGNDPELYAEGILKVCRAYLQSPLACVAGVSGAGLKNRIDAIMENRLILRLNAARKFVLGTSAAAALAVPLLLGLAVVPVAQIQAKAAAVRNTLSSAMRADNSEGNVDNLPGQETPPPRDVLAESQAETLTPPSPDLSGTLTHETLAIPVMVASNGTPVNQPAASAQPATPDGSTRIVASAAVTDPITANAPPLKTEASSVTAVQPVVMRTTPSGTGDPDTIVCRAPQPIAGSNQFGPQACGHNSEWWRLMTNGKDLAPDGKTLITRPTVANPKGDGDPDAIICRTPQYISFGPLIEVCRPNRFWADLIKNHEIVDAHGKHLTRDNSSPFILGQGNYSASNNGIMFSPGYTPAP